MSLTDLARRMFRKAATQPRSTKPRNSTRLTLTALEDRSVPAAITGTVFYDTNADGIQNNNEMTAPGVVVSYTPEGGSPVTGTTDNFGHYTFTEIAPGNYTVAFTAPTGYSAGNPVTVAVGTENVGVVAGLVDTYPIYVSAVASAAHSTPPMRRRRTRNTPPTRCRRTAPLRPTPRVPTPSTSPP